MRVAQNQDHLRASSTWLYNIKYPMIEIFHVFGNLESEVGIYQGDLGDSTYPPQHLGLLSRLDSTSTQNKENNFMDLPEGRNSPYRIYLKLQE